MLKLDLHTYTWTLVDNYGDIPSVRMGMISGFCLVSSSAHHYSLFFVVSFVLGDLCGFMCLEIGSHPSYY